MNFQAKHFIALLWALVGAILTGGIDAIVDQLTTGTLDLLDPVARRRVLTTAVTGGLVAANLYLKRPHGEPEQIQKPQGDSK